MRGIGGSSAAQELAAIRKDLSHVNRSPRVNANNVVKRPVV